MFFIRCRLQHQNYKANESVTRDYFCPHHHTFTQYSLSSILLARLSCTNEHQTPLEEYAMSSCKIFVLSILGALALSVNFSLADYPKEAFGTVAITKERSVEVPTKDYGTLHCVGIEFQRPKSSLVIINGKSDQGFSGGMIYEIDEQGSTELFALNSVWGGVLYHTEPGYDDATIQVRLAVASICLGALHNMAS